MYVILTSKPGQFRSEVIDGLQPVETYDYLFYGVKKATFVIAELLKDTKVRIIDEAWSPPIVNEVPSKFLEKFATRELAFAELQHLTSFGNMNTALQKI
jgi:hypothetical protein